MKKLLLILALLIPIMANAAKIVTDEKDAFTGERTVITSWESFKQKSINIRFRLQNGNVYLDFKYITGSSIVIPQNGKLMFKGIDDNICEFNSVGLFKGGKGDGSVNLIGSSAWGIYANYTGDVAWFKDHIAALLRLYTTDGYEDKKLSDKEGKKLQELSILFYNSIEKGIG